MKRRAFFSALVLAAGALCADKASSTLPKPYQTPSATNRPKLVSRPDGVRLRVPQGFEIEEYASGFEKPRFMIQGPSGEVLVSDSVAKGKVYVLRNKERKVLLEGLDRPYGLALWKDYLYVAEPTSLKRYKYDKGAMTAGKSEEILAMTDYTKGHWTRSLLFDRKGRKLYVGVGSESNGAPGGPEWRATINRINPDGSGREIYASGLRNTIGMRWFPGTDTLWAAVQERDGLGDDLVPDFFTSIKQGGFYGWPYAYVGPNEDPTNKGQRDDLVKKTLTPDVLLGAHVAVLDFTFYQGKQFPAKYRNGAFLAYHGSQNRAERVGYSVVFVPFKNGKPQGPPEDFLTGWMMGKDKVEVWGRPVAVAELSDGSLLVSDDGGNKIWRISYKG
ncbi:MAG TPA: PQQ-dependent sugar dehydrogenase [Bryobacteraceae bacterium]|nr:PQQ-dependent sugar dehydrogenase [Bryobacteraceae bacterium]